MVAGSISVAILVLLTMTPPTDSHHSITKARAHEIATKVVAEISASTQHNFVIQEEKTIERPFGWVFFYTTRRYLETHDPNGLVPGATPVVVLRADGSVDHLASSVPPARAMEIYEKRWLENQHAKPAPK